MEGSIFPTQVQVACNPAVRLLGAILEKFSRGGCGEVREDVQCRIIYNGDQSLRQPGGPPRLLPTPRGRINQGERTTSRPVQLSEMVVSTHTERHRDV